MLASRPMRRRGLVVVGVLALAALLAGCGGGSGAKGKVGDARAEALSYLPKGGPAVVEITTAPGSPAVKSALGLANRFPGSSLLLGQLEDLIVQGTPLSYARDVRPALGNPLVLAPVSAAGLGNDRFVGAIVATDAGQARSFVAKVGTKAGSHAGMDVYRNKKNAGSFFGLNGATVVFADGLANLQAAIDRHAHDTGANPADATGLTAGLPSDALVKVYGLVAPLIARGAGAAKARSVPFVNALKGYGVTVTATNDGLAANFRVDTSAASLPPSEQPLAAGGQPAALAATGPVDVGVRDVAHVVQYGEHLAQALSPATFPRFLAGLRAIGARTGIAVQRDFLGQLGDAAIATDTTLFAVRVKAKDAAVLRTAIARLTPVVPVFLQGAGLPGLRLGAGPGGLTLLGRGRHYVAAYGVVGGELVLGTAPPAQLAAFARQRTAAAAGTSGALAFRGTTTQLAQLILASVSPSRLPQVASLFLSRLGDAVGSATETAQAIAGRLTIPVH
jgi:hypothetical protein